VWDDEGVKRQEVAMTHEPITQRNNEREVVVFRDASPEKLQREAWRFWFYPERPALVLEAYQKQSRPSRRSKWRADESYERKGYRDSTLSLAEVSLPDHVATEAIAAFSSRIAVTRELIP
jgi:hypothetical protein